MNAHLLRNRAPTFAARAHRNQLRKGTDRKGGAHDDLLGLGVPYLAHAAGVGMLLLEHRAPEHVVAAGILHDVLEDTPATYETLQEVFGSEIADLVRAESEPDKSFPWRARKEHTIRHLNEVPFEVRLVAAADKLHNLQSMIADLEDIGPNLWERFNASQDEQAWYYGAVSQPVSRDGADSHPLFMLLEEAVTSVFGRATPVPAS